MNLYKYKILKYTNKIGGYLYERNNIDDLVVKKFLGTPNELTID